MQTTKEYFDLALTLGTMRDKEVYGMRSSNWSRKLRDFIKIKTKKNLIISTKPIATWISGETSNQTFLKYGQFFAHTDRKINGVMTKNERDTSCYIGSTIYEEGIQEQLGRPVTDLSIAIQGYYSYARQRNATGEIAIDGNVIEFFPVNFNRMAIFKFGSKELTMPYFYKAPHDEINNLTDILTTKRNTTRKIYKATVSNDGNANLGIMEETDTTITLHIMSLVGLYFVFEMLMKYTEATTEEWNAFIEDETFRKLAETLLVRRRENLEQLQRTAREQIGNLTTTFRAIKTTELLMKETDTAAIIKKIVQNVKEQAYGDPMIQNVYIKDGGMIGATVGPLIFSAYHGKERDEDDDVDEEEEEFDEPRLYTDREDYIYNKEKYEILTKDLGYIEIDLKRDAPNILSNGERLSHPHVHSDAHMCTGTGSTLYSKLIGDIEIVSAIKLIVSLLSRYNPNSPVSAMGNFEEFRFNKPVTELRELPGRKYIYKQGEK